MSNEAVDDILLCLRPGAEQLDVDLAREALAADEHTLAVHEDQLDRTQPPDRRGRPSAPGTTRSQDGGAQALNDIRKRLGP